MLKSTVLALIPLAKSKDSVRTNLPVIFNFHGYSGQADQFFSSTNLIDIADSNGVVLVYPQGALLNGGDSHWNAAPMNSNSFLNKSDVDDIGFIMTLLDEVNQNNILDLSVNFFLIF